MADEEKKNKKPEKQGGGAIKRGVKEDLHALNEPTYEEKLKAKIESMPPEKREAYEKRLRTAKRSGGRHPRPPKGYEIEQYPGKNYSYKFFGGKPVKSDVEKVKSIRNRVRDATSKKTEAQNENPKANMPDRFSPEGFIWLFWAFMLDMLGLISVIFIALFGIGFVMSLVVDFFAISTIGIFMYLKTKHMPSTKRFSRLAKRMGWASAVEVTPILGDLVFSWTIYLWREFN